jgi:predicted DNA-binding ribbon-helix-helix protein
LLHPLWKCARPASEQSAVVRPIVNLRRTIAVSGGIEMRSAIVKRSIVIAGHKTSVSLEDEFWNGLKEIARDQRATLSNLVGQVDTRRQQGNLSSTIRLFVLDHYRNRMAALASNGAEADGPMPTAKLAVHQSF